MPDLEVAITALETVGEEAAEGGPAQALMLENHGICLSMNWKPGGSSRGNTGGST